MSEFLIFLSNIRRGTNAKNIKGKNPIAGHEHDKNKPLSIAKNSFFITFTNIIIFLLIMNTIRRNIPNIITLTNLLFGLCAIVFVFEGKIYFASLCILFGTVLDFLDGLTARILNAYSEIGKQLDSFADMVTFGIAPAMILFKLLSNINVNNIFETQLKGVLLIPFLLASITPLCSAIRLAKFNIGTKQETSFIGLPTPALALFITGIALSFNKIILFSDPYFLIIIALLLPLLLISKIQLFSLKFNNTEQLSSKTNIFRITLIISGIVLFFLFWFAAIPFIVILYLILSIINNLIK